METETVIKIKGNYRIFNGLLKITDLLGRTIQIKHFNSNTVILEKKNLNNGIYMITLFDDSNYIGSKRLIIR